MARMKFLWNWIPIAVVGTIFPILILFAPTHFVFAYSDLKHCNGYRCYARGYNDGFNNPKMESPTNACVGH